MSSRKTIDVRFPGGKKVDARIGDMIVHTDQSPERGGEGTAPEPFQLFLASIATCAGIFAIEFCEARSIPVEGMSLALKYDFDEKKQTCDKVSLQLNLPPGFPDQYKKAVVRTMDLCSVKKFIADRPEFAITVNE
jgi:ribosomal protein S12 methylthiotransferase accessory factor